jgi:hypothetical protein
MPVSVFVPEPFPCPFQPCGACGGIRVQAQETADCGSNLQATTETKGRECQPSSHDELVRIPVAEHCRCLPSLPLTLNAVAAAGAGIGPGDSTIV